MTIEEGEGRSAYVGKGVLNMEDLRRKKRLEKALRCPIPKQIIDQLGRMSTDWQRLPSQEKGLLYCEVFAQDEVMSAGEEVQGSLFCDSANVF